MQEYEIRILKSDGRTSFAIEMVYLNDNAAVRSARKMARGATFEVWRGIDCIYGTHREAPMDEPIPNRPSRPTATRQ